jgi:hypothetical protein
MSKFLALSTISFVLQYWNLLPVVHAAAQSSALLKVVAIIFLLVSWQRQKLFSLGSTLPPPPSVLSKQHTGLSEGHPRFSNLATHEAVLGTQLPLIKPMPEHLDKVCVVFLKLPKIGVVPPIIRKITAKVRTTATIMPKL